jgi:hypothetical protein
VEVVAGIIAAKGEGTWGPSKFKENGRNDIEEILYRS